jgi:serine acetyltransferase
MFGTDTSGKCRTVLNTVMNIRIKNEVFAEDPSASQDVEILLKHPVLLKVCHYNFVHSLITESFSHYIND